nr:hypothetical protein [Ailanthus crinkle leaf associated bluner-like virus]
MDVPSVRIAKNSQGFKIVNSDSFDNANVVRAPFSSKSKSSYSHQKSKPLHTSTALPPRQNVLPSAPPASAVGLDSARSTGEMRKSPSYYYADDLDLLTRDAAVQVKPRDVDKYRRYLYSPTPSHHPSHPPVSRVEEHTTTVSRGTEVDKHMVPNMSSLNFRYSRKYHDSTKKDMKALGKLTSQNACDAAYQRVPTTLSRSDFGDRNREQSISAFQHAFENLFVNYRTKSKKYAERYRN